VKGFIEEGRQTGVFDQAEQEMVDGVFRLTERRIDALMTPIPNWTGLISRMSKRNYS